MVNAKTYSQKTSEIQRRWWLIDAAEAPLGRVATQIAKYLIGKHKPTYTPHIDSGDYVVVINARQAVVTGRKETGKIYYRHSDFPGSIKSATLAEVRQKSPEKIIENAVKGMLPKNKLMAGRLKRLKIFSDTEHNHTAQAPQKVEVK